MAFSTPEKQSEYNKKYYAANRDVMRDGMERWRAKNKDKHLARAREYHHENRDKLLSQKRAHWKATADRIAERRLVKKFGLSKEAHAAMFLAQNGCCDLCGKKRKLVVDHCHKTKLVRALLCNPCNTALGLLKEDPGLMWKAIEYIVSHKRAGVAKGVGL